jgi:hypothetical protein
MNKVEYAGVKPGRQWFRKAGLLDLPFIFELIHEGAKNGGFSDFLIFSRGQVFLLKKLLVELFPLPIFLRRKPNGRRYSIFMLDDEAIGFVALEDTEKGGHVDRHISECAISESYQGQKHCWNMIGLIVAGAPEVHSFSALCNKFAVAMEVVLRKHKFRFQRSIKVDGGPPLNWYVLSRNDVASKVKK